MLFVCVGNVCRSPMGQHLLTARLPADRFVVSSAGIQAVVGQPMSPEAAIHLEQHGLSANGFVSRQLVPQMLVESDLVLTATRDIRSRVLEEVPAAMRRTFTVRELAALLDHVAPDGDPAALVARAAAERSSAVLDDYDITDPFQRGPEANTVAADLMFAAVDRIAKGLTS